jgi:gamma-tubulin complex component 3
LSKLIDSASLTDFVRVWHQCNVIQAQMVHFMSELQAFCHLEGIAVPWSEFVAFTEKRSGDLDELIAAHRSYLRAVSSKVLLRSKNREEVSSSRISSGNIMADAPILSLVH